MCQLYLNFYKGIYLDLGILFSQNFFFDINFYSDAPILSQYPVFSYSKACLQDASIGCLYSTGENQEGKVGP